MTYQIVSKFIKDISFEIPNAETLFVFESNITNYNLTFDITSQALKNRVIQIDVILKFENSANDHRKARIEITYAVLIKVG